MAIYSTWEENLAAVNPNDWTLNGNGHIQSPICFPAAVSTSLIITIPSTGTITVNPKGYNSNIEGVSSGWDPVRIYNKSGVKVAEAFSRATTVLTLNLADTPHTLTYINTSNHVAGDHYLLITAIDDAWNIPPFDGNFLPLDAVPSGMVYPLAANTSTTVGTGLLNSNGTPVYVKSTFNIRRGETKHIINADLSINSTLLFASDGALTLTEGEAITVGVSDLNELGFSVFGGFFTATNSLGIPAIVSINADYSDSFAALELADNAVMVNSNVSEFVGGDVFALFFPRQNQCIRSLNKAGIYSLSPVIETSPLGYYQSTVTISAVPVAGMKVFCFTNDGLLIDETLSDSLGVYRFDLLLMREKYMFVAQHDDGDPTTPPEYLATASDWQSPTAY